MKMKNFEIENFRLFRIQKNLHAVRTQIDRAPRDLNGIASDQKQMGIMVIYFQKNYGFPMLRSTQNDQKSILLFGHA